MDPLTRDILGALGTGGTVEMAERVQLWVETRRPGIRPERMMGLAEVAEFIGRNLAMMRRIVDDPTEAFPAPVASLAATKVWDRAQVEVWKAGHEQD
jgi:hypothetical protein